ncbi:4-hydroxybenzoate octaprenyltransferase [Candidatus Pelagibacter sp.]|nr:4-hydroxybenzoate octaprenyltransferase [Candidatus Pelagibacter sp.]
MSEKLQIFLDLTRLKRPIGYMLLFWPCAWGLTAGFNFLDSKNIFFFYIILFLLGSILMRSAGCIVNDIIDRNYDKKVQRTKNRPLASGKVSVKTALMYATALCLLAFLVLINFNLLTIFLALISMPLAFTYPLMKRYTYWPQLFLGITFNYGLILGWVSVNNTIDLAPIILYIGAIFWTLGYDTIYGFQDINDDEIIGLKSTSIKFKKNPIIFLNLCYLIFFLSLIFTGFIMEFNKIYFILLIIIFAHLFYIQLRKINFKSSESCLNIFKSNNLLGFLVFFNLFLGKL